MLNKAQGREGGAGREGKRGWRYRNGEQKTHGEWALQMEELREIAPRVCFTKLHMQENKKKETTSDEARPNQTRPDQTRSDQTRPEQNRTKRCVLQAVPQTQAVAGAQTVTSCPRPPASCSSWMDRETQTLVTPTYSTLQNKWHQWPLIWKKVELCYK